MARPKTKTRTQSANEYHKKVYDRVALFLKKGEKDLVKAHAEAQGESLNGFIKRAIQETMERDQAKRQESSALHVREGADFPDD